MLVKQTIITIQAKAMNIKDWLNQYNDNLKVDKIYKFVCVEFYT